MRSASSPLAVFNQVLAVVVSLVILAAAVAVVVEPQGTASSAQQRLGGLAADPATLLLAAVVVGVLALIVLLIEVWPRWHRSVFEARVDGGVVEYSSGVVAESIRQALATQDGARDCQVEIAGRGSRVQTRVQLRLDPGTDPQIAASRLSGLARDRIKSLGLTPDRLRMVIESPTETYDSEVRPAAHAA
jgi:hypothetical protein